MQVLVDCLGSVGKATTTLRTPDGSRVLVLPYGGRVIGLFSAAGNENFYWTNAALAAHASARAFYASEAWHNSGGDRTWLAPELDFFFPNYPTLDCYFQPRQFDPGSYEISPTADGLRLVNRFKIAPARSKRTVSLELAKTISPAANPLRYERDAGDLLKLEYAGYTQQTALAIVGEPAACVGAWNLVQMPHGGELLVPVHARTSAKVLFGEFPPEDLTCTDRLVRYRMRTGGVHKIAVRAVATTGRVGYLYATGGQSALIVRNFFVNPSGEYVDVPWTQTEDLGYAVQACNVVHDELGSFSELEYHIPAIGEGTGRTRCDDGSQIWAFRGPTERVRAVARMLLSPEV